MTLPASGAISLFAVNDELGLSHSAQIGLLCTNVRTLFAVASGAVGLQTGYGKANCAAPGSVTYSTPGTYTWTAPTGVRHVSVVAIGGGGGGTGSQGGGGGGLGWKNNISTTPGSGYTVVVGSGGSKKYNETLCPSNGIYVCHAYTVSAPSGGSSSFNGSTVVGGGGTGGYFGAGAIRPGGSYTGDGGGSGGNGGKSSLIGGGGAGGYTGRGGHAWQTPRPCRRCGIGNLYGCNNFCGGGGQAGSSITYLGCYTGSSGGGGTGVGVGKNLSWSTNITTYQHTNNGPSGLYGGRAGSKGQHAGPQGGGTGHAFSGSCFNGSCTFSTCAATTEPGPAGGTWQYTPNYYYLCNYYTSCGGAYGGGGGSGCELYTQSYTYGTCSYNHTPLKGNYYPPGGQGGGGVVRILWNGNSRSYPCTSTGTP